VTEEEREEASEGEEHLDSSSQVESLLSEIEADERANAAAAALRAGWDGTVFDQDAALKALQAGEAEG